MQKNFKCCLLAVMFLAPVAVSAQVTIGSGKVPESFSALELISQSKQGFRLPQMTTTERDAMVLKPDFQSKKTTTARGLQIFNTSTQCVETWNGTAWIASCVSVNCTGFPATVSFCSSPAPTIADLNSKVGAVVQWYSAEVGGSALAVTTALVNNRIYYAGNCTDQGTRRSVTVEIGSCSAAVSAANIRVATFTNVMYDFQHQTLEAYVTSGGKATEYQWQVSLNNSTYYDIPNAVSRTFTIPADVIHKPALLGRPNFTGMATGGDKADGELWFRVRMRNPMNNGTWADATATNTLPIAFIKTTSSGQGSGYLSGYGELNGVKYLTLQKGLGGVAGVGVTKFALLNLGQSDGKHPGEQLNDAGDLGDLYQWGRIADGHERVVWGKDKTVAAGSGNYMKNIFAVGTSTAIARNASLVSGTDYNPYTNPAIQAGQVIHPDYVGKFIYTGTGAAEITWEWGERSTASRARWGNSSNTRAGAADQLSEWSFANNNVCPAGWRVPSRYEWWDIYRGNGSNTPTNVSTTPYVSTAANANDWYWRLGGTTPAGVLITYGGIIISNSDGRKLFLTSGHRSPIDGDCQGGVVDYWGSTWLTSSDNTEGTSGMSASNTYIRIGSAVESRTDGLFVRCVADN